MAARGIRSRLMISTLLMALVVVGVALPLANGVMNLKFGEFELGKARDDADRLQLLLSERMERMRAQVVDYAEWGDAVAYVRGNDAGFLAENITADGMDNFGVDRVFVLGPTLDVRYASEVVTSRGAGAAPVLRDLAPERIGALVADSRVRAILAARGGRAFLVQLGGRWHLVAVAAIVDPNDPQQTRGAGVMGFVSALGPRRAAQIEAVAKLPLQLATTASGPPGSRLEGNQVHTLRQLQDTTGVATAWLDLQHPRPLLEQTRLARVLLLALAAGIFAFGSVLVWRLVDRGLISRLERMRGELDALADGDGVALAASGAGDEVDVLANRFNQMVAALNEVSRQWRHEATHDALTGLGNRASLLRTLDAETHAAAATLLLVDLDGFKTINELFGHAMGDHVLVRVAGALREPYIGQDVYRIGGDEFALRLAGGDAAAAMAAATRVRQAIAELDLGVAQGVLRASVGVALRQPDPPLRGDEFLQRAEVALYEAKQAGRDGRALFDAAMLRELQDSAALARALDRAILDDDIEAWFQPIVAASDARIRSFEVLARWRHRDAGWIEPARFVAIAERNHLAAGLDLAVLRQALQAMPRLQALAPELGLSVNASVQSLLDGGYLEAVTALLSERPALAAALTLEITETAFTDNEQTLVAPVLALQALGVRIVLDDFGVGHSSLARLAHLRPGGIKLDGSFVRHRAEGSDRICRAVIGLAHEFDIPVTAEWIETAEDAACLRDWKCDTLQGHHFAKPMPLVDALAWLAPRETATQHH